MTSKDICKLCDLIEDYAAGRTELSKEDITEKIIHAYKYAGSIGIREGYKSDQEIEEDKQLILEDLEDRCKHVLKVVEGLGMDLFDFERKYGNVDDNIKTMFPDVG